MACLKENNPLRDTEPAAYRTQLWRALQQSTLHLPGSGPSLAPAAQPAARPSSAPAATAAAKQVKRLHSPTEEASQKLQRRGSDGPCAGAAASGVAVNVAAPPRAAAGGGQSVGLPAPTVNGIPANLAGGLEAT